VSDGGVRSNASYLRCRMRIARATPAAAPPIRAASEPNSTCGIRGDPVFGVLVETPWTPLAWFPDELVLLVEMP